MNFSNALASEKPILKKRDKSQKSFQSAIARVLGYAKNETQRNLMRRLHASASSLQLFNALTDQPENPDAVQLAFNLDEFKKDLLAALEAEQVLALSTASQQTLDDIRQSGSGLGFRDPWKLPALDTINFIQSRRNLLKDVPDEIWQEIKDQLSEGLNKGESIADLSKRISAAFDAIEQGRATVIAQTETAAAYSFASNKSMRAAGIKYKQWFHSAIAHVPRPDHLAIDRMIVPIDQPYPVGSPRLMFPHDPEGAPGDVINCGCISLAATDDEYQAQQKEAA